MKKILVVDDEQALTRMIKRNVFLTATVTRDEADAANGEIGGKRFLAKPVKLQDMLDTIDQVLGTR